MPLALAQYSSEGIGQSAFSIPQSQLIQADVLNRLLQGQAKARPVIIQVGSHLMYGQAHIPGSIYAGPGSQASGLTLLASKVKTLQKGQLIVLYCGCCPWSHCPNIGPAFKKLQDLGFTNVKALYLANNFGDDWVGKGYRVEQGN
jgi:rhodanese-related sulfurtransferase